MTLKLIIYVFLWDIETNIITNNFVYQDNGEVGLEITEPTEADSGIYVASAKNPAGEDHCIVDVSKFVDDYWFLSW